MPQVGRWDQLPDAVRQHLIERMRDRAISVSDLNELRIWIESRLRSLRVGGTRTLARLRSAAADRFPRRSCSEARLRRVIVRGRKLVGSAQRGLSSKRVPDVIPV